MNVKRLGFLSGAVLAGVAVYAFYAVTAVSDDDRLAEVLADHCLPFVTSQATPFEGMGRTPGVYDEVDINEDLQQGGAVLIYKARFVAEWGVLENAGPRGDTTFRVCDVKPTYGADTIAGFVVDPDGFIDRYSAIIAPDGALVADRDAVPSGPTLLGWFNANGDQSDGLRVVMTVSEGLVSSVGVVTNLDD